MHGSASFAFDYTVLEGSDREQYFRLLPRSPPLHFHHLQSDAQAGNSRPAASFDLGLFQSAVLPPPPLPPSQSPAASPLTAVLFAGGSVWAMDLLRPAPAAAHAPDQPAFLALAAHSHGAEETVLGARMAGRCIIQVKPHARRHACTGAQPSLAPRK